MMTQSQLAVVLSPDDDKTHYRAREDVTKTLCGKAVGDFPEQPVATCTTCALSTQRYAPKPWERKDR
jgi:hypothetical protein